MKEPKLQRSTRPRAKSRGIASSRTMAVCWIFTFLLGCGAEKTDVEYLESAKSLAASGDIKSYAIELKNALQQNPKNAEARFLLGQYYVNNQLGAPAEKELEKAIEYGMQKSEVLSEMVQALYYQYAFSRLIEYSDSLPAISADTKAEVLFYRGASWINLGNIDKSQQEFEAAVNAAPDSTYGKISQGYLYLIFDKPNNTNEIATSLTTNNPENAEALLLLARSQLALKQLADSASSMEKALSLQPNRLQLYVDTARVQISAQKFEVAEKNVDHVLKIAPKHLPSNILKATLRLRDKDFTAAREHADQAVTLSEVNKQAKLLSGMANFYLENWESARDRLLAIKDFVRPGHIAHRMLAYSEFKLGYVQSAQEILSTMGDLSDADKKLLKSFGAEFAREGKIDEATSLYETAAGLGSSDPEALTKMGILKLSQDDSSGLNDLEKALEKDAEFTWARAAMARYYLKAGDTTKAIKTVEELVSLAPDDVESYLLAAEIYGGAERYSDAKRVLDNADKRFPKNTGIMITYSKLAYSQGDLKSSANYLADTLKIAPSNDYALMAYYRLTKRLGDTKPANLAIDEAIAKNSGNDNLVLIKALTQIDQNLPDQGLATLSMIKPESSLYSRAQSISGNIEAKKGNGQNALIHFQNWIKAAPKEPRAYFATAKIQASNNNMREALSTIDQGLTAIPTNKALHLEKVRLLLEGEQINQAKSVIAKYNTLYGQDAALDLIQGTYYAKQGNYSKAEQLFSSSHQLNPSSRTAIGLAEIYIRTNRVDQAVSKLNEWLKEHPADQAVRLYKANLALSTKGRSDKQEALKQYSAIVDKSPNNFVAQNNLAWILGELGQISEAVEHAATAYKLKPSLPAIQDTYGYLLLLSGNVSEAKEILQLAHRTSDGDPSITYHYAMALSQVDKKDEAKQILSSVIEMDFPEKDAAQKLHSTL